MKLNRFTKILLAYYAPYFVFLVYVTLASPERANIALTRAKWGLSVYFIAGLVVVPILAFGPPRISWLMGGIPRSARHVLIRHAQLAAAALILGTVYVLVSRLVPVRTTASALINLFVVVLIFLLLFWIRFRKNSNEGDNG
jgi:hypothetical protein